MTRSDDVAKIRELQAELAVHGVRREPLDFYKMSDDELTETADSISEQLAQRKRFLSRENKHKEMKNGTQNEKTSGSVIGAGIKS